MAVSGDIRGTRGRCFGGNCGIGRGDDGGGDNISRARNVKIRTHILSGNCGLGCE